MDKEFLENLGLDSQTVEAVLQAHDQVVRSHAAQLAEVQLQQQVSEAVLGAGGRSVKAISALLDLDAISKSEDVGEALEEAISALKKDSGYLFRSEMPPRYARFTGSQEPPAKATTLAGALRERMKKK